MKKSKESLGQYILFEKLWDVIERDQQRGSLTIVSAHSLLDEIPTLMQSSISLRMHSPWELKAIQSQLMRAAEIHGTDLKVYTNG